MPVFVDALIGDTLHLSAEEFGAYCLLLFATWRNNGKALADDDSELAQICRISRAKWRKNLREKLVRFFDVSDGFWHQRRLEREWAYVQEKARVSRQNGAHGGRPKANPAGLSRDTAQDTRQGAHTETTQPQPQTKNPSQSAVGVSEPRARDPGSAGQAGWLAGLEISEDWLVEADAEREAAGLPSVDLRREAREILKKWRDEPPHNPHAAWIGWAMKARPERANGSVAHSRDPPRQTDVPTGPPPPLPKPH